MSHAVRPPARAGCMPGWIRATAAGALMVCILAGGSSSVAQQTTAVPWTGTTALSRTTRQIMSSRTPGRAAVHDAAIHRLPSPRRRVDRTQPPPDSVPDSDAAVSSRSSASPTELLTDPITSSPNVGLSFTAATYPDSNFNPPSPSGAAGPDQFLLALHGRIRVFDKTTGAIGSLDTTLEAFFDTVRDGRNVVDPRVRYDRFTQRWFVLASNNTLNGSYILAPNRILLAVSDGPTISGATVWSFFYFRHDEVNPPGSSTCIADCPTLGIDAHALYVGVNVYCGLGSPAYYSGTAAFVVPKSSVLGAGPIVVSAFRDLTGGVYGTGPYSPQGVDNYDPDPPYGYIIGVNNDSFGSLVLRRIENPAGTPSISGNLTLSVPWTYPPIDVPHLGNSIGAIGYLTALDDRLAAAHVRDGRLWAAHNIGVNSNGEAIPPASRVAVRWYELRGLSSSVFLASSGTIYHAASSNPLSYWMPSIMSSGHGQLALGFNIAGSNSYVDVGAVSFLPGVTTPTPLRVTYTSHAYNPIYDQGGSDGRRWGECSQVSLDPADDMTFWTTQQFTAGDNIWGVQVTQLVSTAPVLSSVTQHACQTDTHSIILLTGSGFYDPGEGYSRPTLEISGGDITVTSLTVVDSHSLSATLAIAPDAPWTTRDVIYTNPDGQSAILEDGLVVHGGRANLAGDCFVDAVDILAFAACATGPGILYDPDDLPEDCNLPLTPSHHLPPDFDDDYDVDAADFAVLQRCLTAPGQYISEESECRWGVE